MTPEKVKAMKMSKVFPAIIAKAIRKGYTEDDVLKITRWMTGYSDEQIQKAYAEDSEMGYGEFFENMPDPNPNRELVTGVICKVRVETIEDPVIQDMRRLDKMVDELVKGKSMEKILRNSK